MTRRAIAVTFLRPADKEAQNEPVQSDIPGAHGRRCGAAVLGFFYLDGPEAVQEYLDSETTASQPSQQVRSAYPASVVQDFMGGCLLTSGDNQTYCSCALEETQARYTLEEYTTLEIRMLNTGQFPEELAGVIAKCIQ